MKRDKPTFETIASAYQVTRQNIQHLEKRLGLTRAELCDPEQVFSMMLVMSRRSPLREKLADSKVRDSIKKVLAIN